MKKKFKLAILNSHPIQYFPPLYRELAKRPEIDLTVYFCSRQGLEVSFDPQFGQSFKWDIPLLEGYRSVFLPNLRGNTSVQGFFKLINPSIVTELARQRYDALVVHGYEHFSKWLAFLGASLGGTRLILRGESTLLFNRPWYIRASKDLLLRPLMRLLSAATYIGENNRHYYRYYGVDEKRLFFTPYVVDNDFFQSQYRFLLPQRASLRATLGISPEKAVILACGKLIELKQPLLLLRAFQQIREKHDCALIYVGDGVLRGDIERIVQEESIPDVIITGFVNQSRISEFYTIGDLLVLPSSQESWGLVVNEAMNFALPIVASDQVGSASNLVRSGENGYVVPYKSPQALAEALEKLVVDHECRHRFGQRSLEIIADFSLQKCADGIIAAVTTTEGENQK